MVKGTKILLRINLLFWICSVFLLISGNLYAGNWYIVHENSSYPNINAAVKVNDNFNSIYAVGDAGQFIVSRDQGYHWQVSSTINTLPFISISSDGNVGNVTLLAVAGDGSVYRYIESSNNWTKLVMPQGMVSNWVHFDGGSEFWVGGRNGKLAYSGDNGNSWITVDLTDRQLNVTYLFGEKNDIFLIARKNNSSYVLRQYPSVAEPVFKSDKGDTVAGAELLRITLPNENFGSDIFFVGYDSTAKNTSVWSRAVYNSEEKPLTKIFEGKLGEPTDIAHLVSVGENLFWISTKEGNVWESRDSWESWRLAYSDKQSRRLVSILEFPASSDDYGRILGSGGLVLKYGFELISHLPAKNQNVLTAIDRIELKFSLRPALDSIISGCTIQSRYQGYLPYLAEYDLSDSTRVFLDLAATGKPFQAIPGDEWNISLSNKILPLDDPTGIFFYGQNYTVNFLPQDESEFKYKLLKKDFHINRPSTNFVSGMFNSDDTFDYIAFSDDTLYCFSNLNLLNPNQPQKISVNATIHVNPLVREQLLSLDVNRDGKIDLMLFDESNVYILLNNSDAQGFVFSAPRLIHHSNNLKQVVVTNSNNNEFIDLIMLNDSLFTKTDITETSNGIIKNIAVSNLGAIRFVRAGDIDANGRQDLGIISESGQITFLEGIGSGSYYHMTSLPGSGYRDAQFADLDENGLLEIVALNDQQVHIYRYTYNIDEEWQFSSSVLTQFSQPGFGQYIDLAIQDFGGERTTSEQSLLDIALISTDSIMFLQNMTQNENEYSFVDAGPAYHLKHNMFEPETFCSDLDKDAQIDLVLFSRQTGQIATWHKNLWQPLLASSKISRRSVDLNWTSFPDEIGNLNTYLVWRDTIPEIHENAFIRSVHNTQMTDSMVNPFQSYWYAVQAIYNDGVPGGWSAPFRVDMFIELKNPLSGILEDTSRYYLAKSPLTVAVNAELQIRDNVEMAFYPGVGLTINGKLNVRGLDEERMVHFFGIHGGEAAWNGLNFAAGMDTVNMEWFSVSNAQNGIRSRGRPVQLRFGGITNNQIGVDIAGAGLKAQNILADSNNVGLMVGDNGSADLKNVNIMHNETNSVIASANSTTNIRNAIIWGNGSPVLINNASTDVSISYSTVDSIEGNISALEISKIPPKFMPRDSGYYRDDYLSATIDAGDPGDDFSLEPQPNGGRINQGLLGGSWLATPSLQPRITGNPERVELAASRAMNDTINWYIRNSGQKNLDISDYYLKKRLSAFDVSPGNPFALKPGDSAAVEIVFHPPLRGNYSDTLIVLNNDPHMLNGVKTVTITGVGLNAPPVVLKPQPATVRSGQLYRYQPKSVDLDGDDVIYRVLNLPKWLSFSDTGYVYGTPALSDTGVYSYSLIANDQQGGVDTVEAKITVIPAGAESAPVVQLEPLENALLRQSAVRFTFAVTLPADTVTGSPGVYRIRYSLAKQSPPRSETFKDTSAIHEIIFYLADGMYRFRVWAYDVPYENGIKEENAVAVNFRVAASIDTTAARRWQMFSFPHPDPVSWKQFEYSDSAAALYTWDGDIEDYREVDRNNIEPGQAFWIYPTKKEKLTFNLNKLTPVDSANNKLQSYERLLYKGWNQVGNPYSYNLLWTDMQFSITGGAEKKPIAEAARDSLIDGVVYWFGRGENEQGYTYAEIDSNPLISPWQGYWIKTNIAGSLHYSEKPAFPSASTPAKSGVLPRTANEWRLNLNLINDHYSDRKNIIGLSNEEKRLIFEPPHFGDYCALYFPSGKGKLTQKFENEFLDISDTREWDIVVESGNGNLKHTLSWDKNYISDHGIYVYLVDTESETTIDMGSESEFTFTLKKKTRAFKIYASQDETFKPKIIPAAYTLEQNYPNPFNPATTIRFGLPAGSENAKVMLKIYDLLGKEVITVFEGNLDSGYHEVNWNGINQAGSPVASGIYFYQLKSDKKILMKKMVLVR